MQSEHLKTLFLAWQAPDRQWFPVGRLMADVEKEIYQFDYTMGALSAKEKSGFAPLVAFPDFDQHYSASELFPLFRNRLLAPSRKNFTEYLGTLDLDPGHTDALEMLALTGGQRQTDSFEVFPKINKEIDGTFLCRFFLHGLRYVNDAGAKRASELQPGDTLQISLELNNPKTGMGILLHSTDYLPLGWTPRYLVTDLLHAMTHAQQLIAKVVKVNLTTVPQNRRYLIEMSGCLPEDFQPMAGEDFQPIH